VRTVVAGDRSLPRRLRTLCHGALVIAADGGADRLRARGVAPDAVVGDLDSLSDAARAACADRLIHDDDPHRTDLEKAVAGARARGADDIAVVGWAGARIDHTLAALGLLYRDGDDSADGNGRGGGRGGDDSGDADGHPDPRVRLIDDRFTARAVAGTAGFAAPAGTLFSLIALPQATVTLRGARWPLDRARLALSGRGVHNEVGAEGRVMVECHDGRLVLCEGRRRARHG